MKKKKHLLQSSIGKYLADIKEQEGHNNTATAKEAETQSHINIKRKKGKK